MNEQSEPRHISSGRFAAIAGICGAVLASSCCVVPLLLVTFGVSGAWIGSLSAFDPYKEYLAAITVIFLGAGFWQVYFKKSSPCDDDSFCATPQSGRITKTALWIATFLVLIALSIDWWAPLFY